MKKVLAITGISLLTMFVAVPAYALPAMLSLSPGQRSGLEPLTISQAAMELRATGLAGKDLVEAARALVAERMSYCRRNSYDNHEKAFERGYGYCSQMADALADLLTRLGFEAEVVHAFQNRFPDGTVSSHAWVQVTVEQETYYVDSLFYDAETRRLTFTPLSEVVPVPPLLKTMESWGAAAVNAYRYYRTGKDQDW